MRYMFSVFRNHISWRQRGKDKKMGKLKNCTFPLREMLGEVDLSNNSKEVIFDRLFKENHHAQLAPNGIPQEDYWLPGAGEEARP